MRVHLEGCDACRADYDALQATRTMLQQMPYSSRAPLFRGNRGDGEPHAQAVSARAHLHARLAPTFAGGSVLAFVLLVFLFAANAGAPKLVG